MVCVLLPINQGVMKMKINLTVKGPEEKNDSLPVEEFAPGNTSCLPPSCSSIKRIGERS